MHNHDDKIRWPRRVSKDKLRRLYESDAAGRLDEELLEDVALTLLLRCQCILDIAEAKRGRVKCPRCAESGTATIIGRALGRRYSDAIRCPACGWETTWPQFVRSFQRKQLNSGGAMSAFTAYVRAYPAARTARERMLLVDRLIHEFHYSYAHQPDRATRAVAPNLINGKLGDVIEFLDRLSAAPGELTDRRQQWQRTIRETVWGEMNSASEHGLEEDLQPPGR